MYCNRCGKEMAFGQQFCSACGAPVADARAITAGRVQRHIQLLSILWFVYSFFTLLGGGIVLVLANTLFVYLGGGDMQRVPGFLQPLLSFIAILLLAKALAGFAAGWGLLQRERWARPVALVLGFLSLLNPPFGTALGIYTLWVLLPSEAGDEYGGLTAQPVSDRGVAA